MSYDKRTNPKLEAEGVWFEYDDGEFEVLLGRAGGANQKFKQAMERLSKPIRRALENDMVSNDRAERLLREVYAESVILGWRIRNGDGNLVDGKMRDASGNVVPFNSENVLALISAPSMGDYWAEFRRVASSGAAYRAELKDNDTKN